MARTPRQSTKTPGPRSKKPPAKARKARKDKIEATVKGKLAAFHNSLAPAFDKTLDNMSALANGSASPFHDGPNDVPPGSIPHKKGGRKKKQYEQNDDGGGKEEPMMPAQPGKFKADFDAVLEMSRAEGENFSADAMALRLYKLLASMLINLVPLAEDKYLRTRSESSMYALCGALNNLKDMTDLIRTHSSQDQKVETLIATILSPIFLHLAQHLLSSAASVKTAIDGLKLKPRESEMLKKSLDDMVRHHAIYLNAQNEATIERTRELLAPSTAKIQPAPKSKKKGKKQRAESEGE